MRARSSRPIALFCADRDRKGTEVKGPRPEKGRWAPVCVCVGVAAPTLDLGYCYRRMSRKKVRSRGRDLHFFTKAQCRRYAARSPDRLNFRGLRPGFITPAPLRGSVLAIQTAPPRQAAFECTRVRTSTTVVDK